MKLLHIDSSVLGDNSVSRKVSAAIVARLTQAHPGLDLKYRDLAKDVVPHLSGAYLAAQAAGTQHDAALQHDLALGMALMDEFLAADIVVVGAPMYNFSVPSQLKAWIDRVVVAGKTFRYSEAGVESLAKGKRLIIALSRGGFYGADTPMAAFEHLETYLQAVFGFIGMTVEVIHADGIALGPDQRQKSVDAALLSVEALAA